MPRGGGNDDNRADQMNPNNDSYWESRGYDERPDDWEGGGDDDDGRRRRRRQPRKPAESQQRCLLVIAWRGAIWLVHRLAYVDGRLN